MSDLTTTGAAKLRDAIGQNAPFSAGAELYVALHSGDPGADGSANEILTASGYARVAVAAPGEWDVYSDGAARGIENSVAVDYAPEGDWPTVTHVSLAEDATDGDHIAAYPLDRERSNIITGDTPRWRPGELRFELG